jgi:hypothetical protein
MMEALSAASCDFSRRLVFALEVASIEERGAGVGVEITVVDPELVDVSAIGAATATGFVETGSTIGVEVPAETAGLEPKSQDPSKVFSIGIASIGALSGTSAIAVGTGPAFAYAIPEPAELDFYFIS